MELNVEAVILACSVMGVMCSIVMCWMCWANLPDHHKGHAWRQALLAIGVGLLLLSIGILVWYVFGVWVKLEIELPG